mmetsp:Transcript_116575/g.202805  ORF Transcript_116575/g.202805 Transcript_116575/m.202805 type:complete len:122 (+) Transcript_116575:451-816(+)
MAVSTSSCSTRPDGLHDGCTHWSVLDHGTATPCTKGERHATHTDHTDMCTHRDKEKESKCTHHSFHAHAHGSPAHLTFQQSHSEEKTNRAHTATYTPTRTHSRTAPLALACKMQLFGLLRA